MNCHERAHAKPGSPANQAGINRKRRRLGEVRVVACLLITSSFR